MDFDSPDVEKDFPGLYASESSKKSQSRDSDYSDEEKTSRKDLLGKKREKRESKKDKGYAALEGESSGNEDETSQLAYEGIGYEMKAFYKKTVSELLKKIPVLIKFLVHAISIPVSEASYESWDSAIDKMTLKKFKLELLIREYLLLNSLPSGYTRTRKFLKAALISMFGSS